MSVGNDISRIEQLFEMKNADDYMEGEGWKLANHFAMPLRRSI